jgi:hypothetical protein
MSSYDQISLDRSAVNAAFNTKDFADFTEHDGLNLLDLC